MSSSVCKKNAISMTYYINIHDLHSIKGGCQGGVWGASGGGCMWDAICLLGFELTCMSFNQTI
jgi:hypothetical protein